MPQEWVEVNIVPSSWEQPETLLLEVVDPLVQDQLRGVVSTWFYFWESQPEPALRLRIRWHEPIDGESNGIDLAELLSVAQREGKLIEWYEGNHGNRGETYEGEADLYGKEMWELTAKDWMSSSELALGLVKLDSQSALTQPREFHWKRRVHLFSNQLLRDEVPLCLDQAYGYLRERKTSDPRVVSMLSAIEQYFVQQP